MAWVKWTASLYFGTLALKSPSVWLLQNLICWNIHVFIRLTVVVVEVILASGQPVRLFPYSAIYSKPHFDYVVTLLIQSIQPINAWDIKTCIKIEELSVFPCVKWLHAVKEILSYYPTSCQKLPKFYFLQKYVQMVKCIEPSVTLIFHILKSMINYTTFILFNWNPHLQ